MLARSVRALKNGTMRFVSPFFFSSKDKRSFMGKGRQATSSQTDNKEPTNKPGSVSYPLQDNPETQRQINNAGVASSIFFDGIAQSTGEFIEKSHQFKPQLPHEATKTKLANTKDPESRERLKASLLLLKRDYHGVIDLYNASAHQSAMEVQYLEALCYTDPKKLLDRIGTAQAKLYGKVKYIHQHLINGVLASGLPVDSVKKAFEVARIGKTGKQISTSGFNFYFKEELQGRFSASSAAKLQFLIDFLENSSKPNIDFNLKKLVGELLQVGRLSQQTDRLLEILKKANLLTSTLSVPQLISYLIKQQQVEELITLLANSDSPADATKELKTRLLELKYQGKLNSQLKNELTTIYKKLRQTKDVTALELFFEFANVFHLDKIIIDGYDQRIFAGPAKLRLQEMYVDSLLRLPLVSYQPLTKVFKIFSSNPLAEIKLLIKNKDIELAFKKFEVVQLKPLILEFQREHLRHFLYAYYDQAGINNKHARDRIDQFCQRVDSDSLLKLFFTEEDYNKKIEVYLPKDYESLWDKTVELGKIVPTIKQVDRTGKREPIIVPMTGEHPYKTPLEKEVEVYLLGLQAILVQAEIIPATQLLPRFLELRKTATPEVISVLEREHLYNFDFLMSNHEEVLKAVYKLRDNNYVPVLEMRFEDPDLERDIPTDNPNEFVTTTGLMPLRNLNLENLPTLIIDFNSLWEATRRLVRLSPSNLVNELLVWGAEQREPMAIYMGEKVAMVTRQKIPHHVAKAVEQTLSFKKVDDVLDGKCKAALEIVGRINRDDIYDFDREYDHILEHNNYQLYLDFLSSSTFHPLENNLIREQMQSPVRWMGKFRPTLANQLESIRERAQQ